MALVDGRLDSGVNFTPPAKDAPLAFDIALSEPFTARGFELAFLPVPCSGPGGMTVTIESADKDGAFTFVGEFKSERASEACIAPRFFVELDPVTASRFRVTLRDASMHFGFGSFLPSEIVFHSQGRMKRIDTYNSMFRLADTRYERAKTAAPRWGFNPAQVVDLSSHLKADGTLAWDVPPGKWQVLRFGHSCIGMMNHPAPPGQNGLEIDKLSKEAYDLHWKKGIQPYLDAAGDLVGRVFTTIHRDSPECGNNHWTPKMPDEFERRRGYSIIQYLPAFAGLSPDGPANLARFNGDLSQTMADLTHENNYDYSHEVIRGHGMKSSTESYSRVFSSLIAPRTADIPMSEVWLHSYNDGREGGRSGAFGTEATRTMAGVIQQHGQRYVGCEAFYAGPP